MKPESVPQRPPAIFPLLVLLLGAACISVISAVFFYRGFFSGPVTADSATWGQFGDYFGGTLNPILGFLSFIALIATLAIQSRQLEISAKQLEASQSELEATRLELKRSADAQASTATALIRQAEMAAVSARISALSTALQVLDRELEVYNHLAPHQTGYAWKERLNEQRSTLVADLDATVQSLRSAA